MDLNLVSPENLLNPTPLYKALRETDPVHWSPQLHGWVISRYEDVRNGFRDPRFSANRVSVIEQQFQGFDPMMMRDFVGTIKKQMIMFDGMDHIRMRRQTSPSFAPQALDNWMPAIRKTMQQLLNQVQDQGHMDFVPTVAYELPPRVIAFFMGVPQEDQTRLMDWATPIARLGGLTVGMDVVKVASAANTAIREFAEYLMAIAQERHRNPTNDLLSRLMTDQQNGMTPEEVVANAILLLVAGHMTTTDQVCNVVYDLLTHPEQLQLLRDNPKLLPQAVEESMRFHTSVPFHYRVAAQDFELRGKKIKKGDMMFMGIASANRDSSVFTEPDRFDITRNPAQQKHLAFSFGPHHCLGAGLARRELEVALEELLQRMPNLRLDEDNPAQHKCTSLIFRGFTSLHLRW